jgi:hypothetical protein
VPAMEVRREVEEEEEEERRVEGVKVGRWSCSEGETVHEERRSSGGGEDEETVEGGWDC